MLVRKLSIPLIGLAVSANVAFAQVKKEPAKTTNPLETAPTMSIPTKLDAAKTGWHNFLSLGLNGNINESKKIIGKPDGNTTTLGTKILGKLSLRQGSHDLRNDMSFIYASTRTPYVPKYVKSDDQLTASSIYIYRLDSADWFGPFVRMSAKTTTSEGHDVRPRDRDYVIAKRNGDVETTTSQDVKLNDPWKPTITKETLGAFFEVYGSPELSVELLVGAGARQTFAAKQLVSIDDATTDEIELLELNDSRHMGPEVILQAAGTLVKDRIIYSLVSDVLFPTVSKNDAEKKRAPFEGRIIDTAATISFKLVDWASIDFTHKALRDLDLSDKPQSSNSVLFSIDLVVSGEDS